MPRKTVSGLLHVKTVRRGVRDYLYFNTGLKDERGKPIYTPLPAKSDMSFGTAYATATAVRTRRESTPDQRTVPQLIDLYRKAPELRKLSQGTQKTYEVYLRRLAVEMDKAPADEVEERDIYALIDKMADTPAAADMMLLICRKLFGWAKKRQHVRHDPTTAVEFDYEAGEYDPWPEELVDAALQDEKVGLPVALLYFTAQRIGDVCRMAWGHIRDGVVHVTQQKTGTPLEIPVHERLATILASAARNGVTILTSPKGQKAKDQTIRKHIQAFAAERGFEIVPHGLRKNAVNALLEAGCSTGETSAISGQSLAMVEHYAKRRNSPRMGKVAILKWERTSRKQGNTRENDTTTQRKT